jgi:heptosyltransferase I
VKLRRRRFDLLVDMHGNGRCLVQSLVIGAPRRLAFELRRSRNLAFSDTVPYRLDVHTVLRQAEVLKPVGVSLAPPGFTPNPETAPLRLNLTEDEIAEARELLAAEGIAAGQPYLVMQVTSGGSNELKQWLPERFAAAADRIQDELDVRVVMGGQGEAERAIFEAVLSQTNRPVVNLFGRTTLRSMAALIYGADLYLGCDTGPMHLAAALGRPIVALFGPTDPGRWRPWSRAPVRLLRAGLSCSPCPGRVCSFNIECMRSLEVDGVMAAVRELLSWPGSPVSTTSGRQALRPPTGQSPE